MNLENAEASVYTENNGVFYIKLSFSTGTYISGITVKKSPKYGGWWVQMPYYRDYKTKNTKRYIEFDQDSQDREVIDELCTQAVDSYIASGNSSNSYTDTLPKDEDIDKPVDLSKTMY